MILSSHPPLDTYVGWQHYRTHCGLLVPAPAISPQQWSMLPESRQYDYNLYRELTNANLPLQDTPMHDKEGGAREGRVDGALLAGAHGVVPDLGNVDARRYVRLHAAASAGDWATARAELADLL